MQVDHRKASFRGWLYQEKRQSLAVEWPMQQMAPGSNPNWFQQDIDWRVYQRSAKNHWFQQKTGDPKRSCDLRGWEQGPQRKRSPFFTSRHLFTSQKISQKNSRSPKITRDGEETDGDYQNLRREPVLICHFYYYIYIMFTSQAHPKRPQTSFKTFLLLVSSTLPLASCRTRYWVHCIAFRIIGNGRAASCGHTLCYWPVCLDFGGARRLRREIRCLVIEFWFWCSWIAQRECGLEITLRTKQSQSLWNFRPCS